MSLSEQKISQILADGTPVTLYEGKRVLVLTPDGTRSCPLAMMVRLLGETLGARAARLDFMGTHPVMTEQQILELYRIAPADRQSLFGRSSFFCHRWDLPETFRRIGELTEEEVAEISGGLLRERVPIDINRAVFDYDLIIILGPVFPHEVVGFSGGAKYLFPGISGGEFLHFFHWLSALITCRKIIGRKENPVREVIHRALEKLALPLHLLAMVVGPEAGLQGLFVGDIRKAWSAAADLSATVHIVEKEKPFRIVLGRAPEMYDEIWVAGKVVYKLEQAVAPGGTLIVYAPHVREISRTWGDHLEQVGYHVRDYFLAHPEILCSVPRGVLAHSTQVCGTGCYEGGVETPDIQVVLATAIPEETCRKIGLGYLDPASVRLEDYMNREDQGILFVDHAGETLYRVAGQG
jgi:nickel-dependent lactate racemase